MQQLCWRLTDWSSQRLGPFHGRWLQKRCSSPATWRRLSQLADYLIWQRVGTSRSSSVAYWRIPATFHEQAPSSTLPLRPHYWPSRGHDLPYRRQRMQLRCAAARGGPQWLEGLALGAPAAGTQRGGPAQQAAAAAVSRKQQRCVGGAGRAEALELPPKPPRRRRCRLLRTPAWFSHPWLQ